MVEIRARVTWNGVFWGVDLPTYEMVEDSFTPVIPGVTNTNGVFGNIDPADARLNGLTCAVRVPDDYLEDGRLNPDAIRTKYRGNPQWDNSDLDSRLRAVDR